MTVQSLGRTISIPFSQTWPLIQDTLHSLSQKVVVATKTTFYTIAIWCKAHYLPLAVGMGIGVITMLVLHLMYKTRTPDGLSSDEDSLDSSSSSWSKRIEEKIKIISTKTHDIVIYLISAVLALWIFMLLFPHIWIYMHVHTSCTFVSFGLFIYGKCLGHSKGYEEGYEKAKRENEASLVALHTNDIPSASNGHSSLSIDKYAPKMTFVASQ